MLPQLLNKKQKQMKVDLKENACFPSRSIPCRLIENRSIFNGLLGSNLNEEKICIKDLHLSQAEILSFSHLHISSPLLASDSILHISGPQPPRPGPQTEEALAGTPTCRSIIYCQVLTDPQKGWGPLLYMKESSCFYLQFQNR